LPRPNQRLRSQMVEAVKNLRASNTAKRLGVRLSFLPLSKVQGGIEHPTAPESGRKDCRTPRRFAKSCLSSAPLLPLSLLPLLAPPPTLFAHRLDEYLQATLVSIEPNAIRLQINLTPGVAVAEPVLARIDLDRDGVISTNEAAAYAEMLKRDL